MGVNAQRDRGQLLGCLNGNHYFIRQCAPISITQHQALSSSLSGYLQDTQGVGRVSFKAIKEVLGVKENGKPFCLEIACGISNHTKVFVQGSFQYLGNLQLRAFTDDGNHLYPGAYRGLEISVSLDFSFGSSGAAESNQSGIGESDSPSPIKKFNVLGIGTSPASFYEVDT
ncbi:hypothetical protein ES703_126085 [subsurface metagenome]